METTMVPQTDKDTINLFDVGCLVNLKIKTWSGRKMLTRADLVRVGYDPDNLPEDIVNLGRKLLVPKEELHHLTQIEQLARKALYRWSTPFGISNSHFVPAKMLPTVEAQVKDLKEEFFKRVDSFIVRFADLKQKVQDSHPEFWDKCLKGHYPADPQALRRYFQFDWYTFKIAGMGSIEETTVEDMVAHQKAMDGKEQEMRRQMKEEVGTFVGEYVGAMRGEVVRFCELLTARIDGKAFGDELEPKKLTAKSLSCFANHVDKFRNMNVFGDDQIENMLVDFKRNFLTEGTNASDFESNTVKHSVTTALSKIREQARIEGESGSKFVGELKRRVVL